jgi:hypothetical protein
VEACNNCWNCFGLFAGIWVKFKSVFGSEDWIVEPTVSTHWRNSRIIWEGRDAIREAYVPTRIEDNIRRWPASQGQVLLNFVSGFELGINNLYLQAFVLDSSQSLKQSLHFRRSWRACHYLGGYLVLRCISEDNNHHEFDQLLHL